MPWLQIDGVSVLTLEEVVLEAAVLHVLVDEEAVLVLAAVADQLHQVGVPQLPQEDHLRLQAPNKERKNMPRSRQDHLSARGCRRNPEPSRSLNHPPAPLGVGFRHTCPRFIARRDILGARGQSCSGMRGVSNF